MRACIMKSRPSAAPIRQNVSAAGQLNHSKYLGEQFPHPIVLKPGGVLRFAVRASPMCDTCVELDKKIERYRRLSFLIADQITIDRIKALIQELQTQKVELHPEQKP
jgi:hypothetical protein